MGVEDPISYYGEQKICLALEVLRQHQLIFLVEISSREGKALGSGQKLSWGISAHGRIA
jgi:hypothetical protein